jgi:ribosomal protein S27AE
MPYAKTTRSIKRQAIKSIHEPPTAKDKVKVSGEMQSEKAKMVKELIPFLTYLYKKYMGARITEDMAVLQFEDIKIPISVGDTILGGKFKNKRIVVKSIGKNEKGDITINGRPLLKYRIIDKVEETVLADKIECDNCGWTWMIADGGDDLYICHKCGHDNQPHQTTSKDYKRLNIGEETKRDYKKEYAKYGKSKKAKKYRAELNKYNRDKGTYGNGDGKDASHKGGKIVGFEAESKNRGRREKSRLKKESSINEFGGVKFDLIGFDSNDKPVLRSIKRSSDSFMKDVAKYGSEKLFKGGKGVEYVKIYYDKTHLMTVKDSGRKVVKEKGWKKLPINEIPMGDLQKIDQFADKKLNPVDVVLTDKHFFDRLNDPRNGKEISQAELIGFFKRLGKKKKEFVEFLNQYNSLVAVDDRTNINIPFMKQANKAIAKTVMRKKDFKSTDKKLDI